MNRILIMCCSIVLAACAPATTREPPEIGPDTQVAWPGPPLEARIEYRYSLSEPGDLGIKPGLMKRFVQFFAGRDSQAMLRPYAVAADDQMIAVVDPGLRIVHVFEPGESRYLAISGGGDTLFESPVGIAIGRSAIYVADSAVAKVFIFDRAGGYRGAIEGLSRPTGIVFHSDSDRLFVVDTLENQVLMFDGAGNRQGAFGVRGVGEGQFNFPTSIALHGDTLLVNDTLNYRVQMFALDGTPLGSFGEIGDGSGQFALSKGLGADAQGHVYVADALSNYVQIFDMDGRFLLSFGGMGGDVGNFRLPAGVYVHNRLIYVADSQNGRVQVFEYLGGEG